MPFQENAGQKIMLSREDRSYEVLKRRLQAFQAGRIRETYADIVQIPQYALLGEFFFTRIYGPQDFGFRDHSIKTLHQKLHGVFRGEIIDIMGKVIRLNELSDELDALMVNTLRHEKPGMEWDEAVYGEIYRACANYPRRVYQIELTVDAIRSVHRMSRIRMISWILRAVRGAAQLAGMGRIMNFLSDGYEAFHRVQDIDFFADTVAERETARNEMLFSPRMDTD